MITRAEATTHRLFAVILAAWLASPVPAFGAEEATYRFERMWPTLRQPWYFNFPRDIARDATGNVYVVDSANNRIQKYAEDGQFITQWGRQGSGDGEFNYPQGVAVDLEDNVYVTDTNNYRVQKFNRKHEFVLAWGGPGGDNGEFLWTLSSEWPLNKPGIAVDNAGYVYVADTLNHRIQKFDSSGNYLARWGTAGTGPLQFNKPCGLAVVNNEYLYVVDRYNNRIHVTTLTGKFVETWGRGGDGADALSYPEGIFLDGRGNAFIADTFHHGVRVFGSDHSFLLAWGGAGIEEGNFYYPSGLVVNEAGIVSVVDGWNDRIQKFTSSGRYITKWAAGGSGEGEFDWQGNLNAGIAVDSHGNVYVADEYGHRVQKFTAEGLFVAQWGGEGNGDGELYHPFGLAIDGKDNVYVADNWNNRIQKFTSSGTFITKFGKGGSGDGQLLRPWDVAVDARGSVYVADTLNHRIQRFDWNALQGEYEYALQWGEQGAGEGQFAVPGGIATDDDGLIYVTDAGHCRVQKFRANGDYLNQWGKLGTGSGQFDSPVGICVDSAGDIYVADRDNHRIQKFDSSGTYLGGWGGQLGNRPGQMNRPCAVAAGADGRIYVVDGANHRVEAFREEFGAPEILKAIIVAGGGPYASNTLWPVTQLCTNLAYQSLANQGFSKDTVRYFSWNAKLDLDGNGLADDVAGEPTNSNVHNAISVWAADADHLVLYLVGHGGDGFYVLGETEVLTSRDLGVWLDETQRTVPLVTVVYDANASGSFLPFLVPSGRSQRIVIASTAAAEKAYFVTRGTISFSNYFWANVFNGHSVLDSFNSARKDLSDVAGYQNPQLDDNADGVYDPKSGDGTLADNTYIGFGNAVYDERPTIGSVSPPQTLDADETSASLSADNVADDRTVISRVWAIITAPVAAKAGTEDPVEELPSVDLVQGETDAYEGTYEEFTEAGEYQVDVYAQDWVGNVSEVAQTTVTKSGVLPGTLVGVVTDADTADAIEGALVALTDYGDLSTHTDASGAYVFPALPVDTYRVRASAGDYVSQTKQADVLSGETTTVDFALASIAAVTVTVNQATGQPDPTNTMPIQFAVVFNESVTGFEWRDVAWAGTAAAISGSVQGGGANYTISVAELAGDGTVVPVIPTGVAQNGSGVYNQASTSTDATVEYDVTPPGITLDGPSTMLTTSGPVTYTVWYGNANSVSLSNQDVAVSATGSAAVGDATVSGTGPEQRFVTLSSISGDGTLGITVAAATAQDAAGNLAGPAGPSGTCAVDNTAPTITLGEPSAPFAATGPISFAVSYVGADSVSIAEEDVTLSTTGSAAASTIEVTGAGAAERTITVLGIAGDGTLGVSVAAGTAQDVAGNSAGAAGPSAMAVIDNTPPAISIGEPSATVTAAGPVTYTVSCSGAATVVLAAEHVALHATGTASGSVAVAGAGAETRTVTLSDISGDGSLAISLAAGVAIDEAGNQTLAAGPSTPFLVDSAMVSVAIHPPSVDVTRAGPVVYTVSYANAVNVSLSESDITLNSTGTAAGGVSVTGTGVQTRTVTLADIVGDGALSLTIASATAEDELGNPAPGAGPSAPVTADNAPPALSVGVPSVGLTAAGPVSFTVVYEGADMVALTQDDVLLAGEGTATGAVTIDEFKAQEKGDITRVVTVSDITGDGTLGVSLAAGTAHDLAGNLAAAAGPSAFCTVDNTPPALELSGPSIPVTRAGPIVYTVTYFGAETVTLSPGDVALDATGTATGTVAVSGTGCSERQVNLLNVAGDGTLGVAVAAGTASDAAGNTSSAAQSSLPCVVDNTRPVITLLGDNPATVLMAGTYADAGATAYDEVDGDLTSAIETVDAVDTSQPGAYAVVYSVQDAAGNGAQLTRTVNVISGGEGEGEGEGDGGPPDIVIGCGGTGASNTAGPLNGSNGNAVLMASLGVFLFLSRRKALFWSAKI